MDPVAEVLAEFKARARASAPSKIDAMLDVEQLADPRVVPFLLQVAADEHELPDVRAHVIRVLRTRAVVASERVAVARVIGGILMSAASQRLRDQSALSLAAFTDLEGVPGMLGAVALDENEALDLRYSAFTSLERAGPQPECLDILRQLSLDDTLGRSARRLLATWNIQ